MTAPPDRPAEFLAALAQQDPFGHLRTTRTGPQAVDVEAIHARQLQQLVHLAQAAQRENRGIGVTVWGELGSGKSHLLGRLERWARQGDRAVFVSPYALQVDTDDQLARSVLRDLTAALTRGPGDGWFGTDLYQLLKAFVVEAIPPGGPKPTVEEAEAHFHRLAGRPPGRGGGVGP